MTVEQKVGQVIQADISAITPEDLKTYPLGSILAGGNSGPYGNERADAATWAKLVNAFRAASRDSGAGIPILFGVDAVHGHSNVPGATIFPHNIGLGAAREPKLIERIGRATAVEIAASGIEWTFAPTLAVPQDVRWGRSYEGYSSDPALVALYGHAMTLGLQGPLRKGRVLGPRQVAATAKHFLADGGTVDGRDQGDARIDESALIATHAKGYPAAINAGALTVMASFSSWNGVKHHGNQSLLTDVLKKRMGFEGLVVGDWNGHGQVAGCSTTSCAASLNAGLDLYMAPDSWRGLFDSTVHDVREGRIAPARLDDAVRRILRVKYKLGLMGANPVARGNPAAMGNPAHLALAREAVARSLVLLKNDARILPIKAGAKVVVGGSGADSMAMQTGGWTISWQGTDTTAADFPNGQTIGRAIVDAVRASGGTAELNPTVAGPKPDVAIVVTGETPYAEFQGDVPHLAFRTPTADAAMIARMKAQGTKVVVVFLSGRPMFTGPLLNQADAFVAAWLPGSQGAGVADVLVAGKSGRAKRDFTGRLPFAWPADARGPAAEVQFPLGYGLTSRTMPTKLTFNEDPRIDLAAFDMSRTFVRRGAVPAPWYLSHGGMVMVRAVDLTAQEDGRQFSWTGPARMAIEGTPVDLSRDANAELVLDWRLDGTPTPPVMLSSAGATVDLTALVRSLPLGALTQTRIPLRCLAAAGGNLSSVGGPLAIVADKGFAVSIQNAQVVSGSGAGACPPKAP